MHISVTTKLNGDTWYPMAGENEALLAAAADPSPAVSETWCWIPRSATDMAIAAEPRGCCCIRKRRRYPMAAASKHTYQMLNEVYVW
jgi:hypothetical protein